MDEEIHAIKKNKTLKRTTLLPRRKPISIKWTYMTKYYMTKYKPNGEVDRYKMRLIVKGYKQKASTDYFKVFATVTRIDTVCMIISIAANNS